jgi:hypothetical protein
MSEHKTVVWFGNDSGPNTFFFRSPFRSGKFLANTAVVTSLFFGFGIVVLFAHWQGLTGASRRLFWGAYCLAVGILYPYLRALQYHRRINELYLAGKIGDQSEESPLNDVLEVADDAINMGVLYASISGGLIVFLGLALLFGWLQSN